MAIALADHAWPRLPVELQVGPAGRLLVAGTPRWSRHLPERFFGSPPPVRQLVARLPVWRLPRMLATWRPRVDLVIARVDLISTVWFREAEHVRVPEWIRTLAPVPPVTHRFPSSQTRRKQRLVETNGLSWRVSHDPADLRTFLERDYRPYVLRRHGAEAHLRSQRWMERGLRRGALIWIEQGSRTVAAVLVDRQGPALRYLAAACAHGDARLLRLGALSATFLACFDLARRLGCSDVDLRNSRPFLARGLLADKIGWGGVISEPDDLTHDLLLSWNEVTPAVARSLTEAQLVCRGPDGLQRLRIE